MIGRDGTPTKTTMPPAAVECHSGYTYAQRPVAVWWQGERVSVAHLDAEWRLPQGRGFCLHTHDGSVFALTYSELNDSWQVELL